jgi:diaminopimelate decarboxylase
MELALRSGILLFNIESASELNLLAAVAARLKKRAAIAVRVNPDVSAKTHPYISTGLHQHKFGVPIPEAKKLYAQAAKYPYLKVSGVSVHIGSQITDVDTFQEALERVADLVIGALRRQGHEIRYIDAGGGLGISYGEAQTKKNQFREADCGLRKSGARPVARIESALAARAGALHRRSGGRIADPRPLSQNKSSKAFSDCRRGHERSACVRRYTARITRLFR